MVIRINYNTVSLKEAKLCSMRAQKLAVKEKIKKVDFIEIKTFY